MRNGVGRIIKGIEDGKVGGGGKGGENESAREGS